MNESAVAAKQNDINLVESLIHLLVLLSLNTMHIYAVTALTIS